MKITSSILQDIAPVLDAAAGQFGGQVAFLANVTSKAPISLPPISIQSSSFVDSTTQQAMWGLMLSSSVSIIQGLSITLSNNCFLRYEYDSKTLVWYTTSNSGGSRNCTVRAWHWAAADIC